MCEFLRCGRLVDEAIVEIWCCGGRAHTRVGVLARKRKEEPGAVSKV